MAQKTAIGWTDFSVNPVKYRDRATGETVWACVKKSAGCANCYSESLALRFDRGGAFTRAGMEKVEPFADDKELKKLLNSRTFAGKRVFVADMTDLFGSWVPDELIDAVFAAFAMRPDVTFQLLTKRPGRMASYLGRIARSIKPLEAAARSLGFTFKFAGLDGREYSTLPPPPWKNVWCGFSAENQECFDRRAVEMAPIMRAGWNVWVSAEPLLGPLDVSRWLEPAECDVCGYDFKPVKVETTVTVKGQTVKGYEVFCDECHQSDPEMGSSVSGTDGIRWVVAGGESGNDRRECEVAWIESLVAQCKAASVPCFVKQASGPRPGMKGRIPLAVWETKEFPEAVA